MGLQRDRVLGGSLGRAGTWTSAAGKASMTGRLARSERDV
jgi:hypothetical protein